MLKGLRTITLGWLDVCVGDIKAIVLMWLKTWSWSWWISPSEGQAVSSRPPAVIKWTQPEEQDVLRVCVERWQNKHYMPYTDGPAPCGSENRMINNLDLAGRSDEQVAGEEAWKGKSQSTMVDPKRTWTNPITGPKDCSTLALTSCGYLIGIDSQRSTEINQYLNIVNYVILNNQNKAFPEDQW